MALLHNGDRFPELKLPAVGGGVIDLPGDFAGAVGMVLIYRGAWCPVCNDQLAAFEAARGELDSLGVKLAAFSVDDEEAGRQLKAKLNLTFPIGYGADPDGVADLVGAFTNPTPHYLQPTAFVLTAEGNLMSAVYATNVMGRLTAGEAVRMGRYLKARRDAA